ncbi:MAG TPA: hypothetical protein VME22_08030 [Solirubrobacteraceae bacterium]|nr:hypothetical protein [Solirubrobacteraceae bacterium]
MTTGEHASTLEHLAEMDRLLRDIQTELDPGREPAPALEAPPPEPPPPPSPLIDDAPDAGKSPLVDDPATPAPTAQLQALSQLAARLLASMRELIDGYEQFLVQIPSVSASAPTRPHPVTRQPPAPRRDGPDVTVAAGPFVSLDALRSFEHAVSRLPGVRDVAVRGYEGSDRAIIEVRLDRNGA